MGSIDKKTKILIVTSRLDIGGAEKHLLMVLPELMALGYDVRVFVLHKFGTLNEEFRIRNIYIYEPAIKLPDVIDTLYSLVMLIMVLAKWRPAVIHSFLPEPYIVSACASTFFPRLKRVMSRRSLNVYQQDRPWIRKIEKRLHRTTDYILGNSMAVIEQLKDEGIPEDKLSLIYNGIYCEQFKNSQGESNKRKELGIPEDAVILITVANLIPYKGHLDLLEALILMDRKNLPQWQWICIGEDRGVKQALELKAKQAGLLENIHFTGSVSNPAEYINIADIGVLTSHQEGFSNSILECMCHGLPMIVTDVGGNPEAVLHDENGFVVPVHNVNILSEKILEMITDSELRIRFGKVSRQRVLEQFSIDKCVENYDKLYRQLLHI